MWPEMVSRIFSGGSIESKAPVSNPPVVGREVDTLAMSTNTVRRLHQSTMAIWCIIIGGRPRTSSTYSRIEQAHCIKVEVFGPRFAARSFR